MRTQIDNAAYLGLKTVLTFGTDKPEQWDHYFKAMAYAAAYAQEKGIEVAMKPHGGSSGSSDEIIAGIRKVGHPNFKICTTPATSSTTPAKTPSRSSSP